MNPFEGILLLLGIPVVLVLAGYWLAAAFNRSDEPTRMSIAILTGIASLLLAVSLVNFFLPLSGLAAWGCLTPVFVSLFWTRSRRMFWRDCRTWFCRKSTWLYGSLVLLFFVLLLWPVLSSFTTVMYDGTSNHDSFFWIVVAEHLKRYTYMEHPLWNPLQPLMSAADAVVGWRPAWGRMGSEGLIALCSAVVNLSPLKLYVYLTACLFLPWLAVAHLAIRTFYTERLSWLAQGSLMVFHPIFMFFYSNSNLPNLLGVIVGSTAIIATESALRAGWERRNELLVWSSLLALSLHGLYCSYPEMIPFVFLPCGLLWIRTFVTSSTGMQLRTKLVVAVAVGVSLLLNPATTFRAGWGFVAAYLSARADDRWGNIMDLLHPVQYLPALGTLAPTAAKWLGIWVGGILSLLILIGLGLAWRRARDRWGGLFVFSGGLALLIYTLLEHFVYGWQKSVQFTGIFVSAVLGGVIVDAYYWYQSELKNFRRLVLPGMAGLIAFLTLAVGMQCREMYKWSERKLLSHDWFTLREESQTTLHARPILIEAATFRMAFYHGMWAAYFLSDSRIYFAARGEQGGGYLRDNVINEANRKIPTPAAVLVSRAWADTFDANSRRRLTGLEYVLLRESNRVFTMNGVFPLNGPPDMASPSIDLEILPHSPSQLVMELHPFKPANWPKGTWTISRRVKGADDFALSVSGAPPWGIKVPLIAGKRNQITLSISREKGDEESLPFAIKELRIVGIPGVVP
ncbi:MAG TPA: hypothetical protein VGM64_18205 [Lacunisphaera sp.]|jgi:hypothetical protein